ncbi:hypothetical protein B484DRAFT_84929 [Ochromonadaceae sp. CCMP2298]|nr:hypothetical protein B484DRAFT_84929 [Ochromonadaceae sp. CCMP2298]
MQQSRQQQPQQQQSYSQQPRNGTLELQKHETKYGKRNTNAGNNGNGSNRRNSTGDSLANLGGGQESNYQQQPAQGSNYQQHSNSINSAMKSLQPTKSNSKLPASSQSGLSNPRAAPNMHGPNSSSAASQRKASTCQDSRGAGNSLVPAEFGAYRNPGDWARSNTPVRVPRNTRSGGSGGSGGKSKPRGEVEVVDLLDDDDDICEVVQGVGGQEAQGGNSASAWMGEAHSVPVERLYFGRYCKEVRESPNTDADADADADDTDLGLTGPLLRVEGCRLVVRSRAKFSASSSSSAFDEDVMMFDDVKKIM